ncbi:ABC transporter ATP-binding protein, partial [Bacillus nitratireducens]|nr:ABC transporter ATP-binding protein [Bacillus nitratireducens]
LYSIPGTPPDLLKSPKGDAFAPSNPQALKIDFEMASPLFKVSDTHYAVTWLLHEPAQEVKPPAVVEKRIRQLKEGEQHE